jgi:hypothetical protein
MDNLTVKGCGVCEFKPKDHRLISYWPSYRGEKLCSPCYDWVFSTLRDMRSKAKICPVFRRESDMLAVNYYPISGRIRFFAPTKEFVLSGHGFALSHQEWKQILTKVKQAQEEWDIVC